MLLLLLNQLCSCCIMIRTYLDNYLLLDAVSTVDPLNDVVRATVLDYGISHFYFPFKHAHHKLSIKQELSTTIGYGCRETNKQQYLLTVLDATDTESQNDLYLMYSKLQW